MRKKSKLVEDTLERLAQDINRDIKEADAMSRSQHQAQAYESAQYYECRASAMRQALGHVHKIRVEFA